MQILEYIKIFLFDYFCQIQEGTSSTITAVSLPFNPIKLFFLIVWVYLCLYFVQRVQFSPLVPYKYKSSAYIVSIFAGPLLWIILLIIDTVKKSAQTNQSIPSLLIQQFKKTVGAIKSRGFIRFRRNTGIKLLDSSGRNIDEIYGHSQKHDSRILDLTEKLIASSLDQRERYTY